MQIKKLRVKISFFANFLFSMFILLFLAQAYMHDKNIIYLFVFFLLGIIGSNYFLLRKNLLGLKFEYINTESPFANEVSKIHLRVENSDNFDRFDIRVNSISFHT